MDYKWRATFTIRGLSLRKQWSRDGITLTDTSTDKEKKVEGEILLTTPDYPNDIFDKMNERLDQVLAVWAVSYAERGVDSIPVITDFELKQMNWLDFAKKNLPYFGNGSFTFTNSYTLDTIDTLYDQAVKLPTVCDYQQVIRNMLYLFRQGMSTTDGSQRFWFMWRAFNAFYNYTYGTRERVPEWDRICHWVDKYYSSDADASQFLKDYGDALPSSFQLNDRFTFVLRVKTSAKSFLDFLIRKNLVSNRSVNYSSGLASAINQNDAVQVLKYALGCIYIFRNRLDHGESPPDEETLYLCSNYISRIVGRAIDKHLTPYVA